MGNNHDSSGNVALAFLSGIASIGTVMMAFLGGMTCGAVAALLLTPQTGRESRETVRRLARRVGEDVRDISEKATETWGEVVVKGRELLNEAETVVKDAVDAGRESVQHMRNSSSEESDPSR